MSDDYLERIAIALERIAESIDYKMAPQTQPEKEETPFPWYECSVRLRHAEKRSRGDGEPTTVEQLIRIGRQSFLFDAPWRHVGELTIKGEIDPIMDRLGFGEAWKNS